MAQAEADLARRQAPPNRRWDAGTWLTIGVVLLVWAWNLLGLVAAWQVPTEGWMVKPRGPGEVQLEYLAPQVADTPLQTGDVLLAIDGVPIETIGSRAYAFFRLEPPDWRAGTVLRFTVQRAGEVVDLDVTLVNPTAREVLGTGLSQLGPAGWVQVAGSLFFFAVGTAVFWVRPRERAARALFLIGAGFLWNASFSPYGATSYFYPLLAIPPSVPFDTWTFLINPSLVYLVLVFPTPKWPVRRFPRATPLMLYLWTVLAINLAYLSNLADPRVFGQVATVIYIVEVALTMGVVLGGLLHSALTVRAPAAVAQLKWMALGMLSFVVVGIGTWLLSFLAGPTPVIMAFQPVGQLGWFLLPVCLAIAITRYRLFDIDVIIRRTLVYSVLTGVLALAYLGSVLMLESIFRALTGQGQNTLVVVLSTLAIAALFGPVRARVQRAIDRRFYRRKYDAARTLASFGAQARDVVELEQLSGQLLAVVQETMQPASASLWLSAADKKAAR